jgi:twinkle protein
VNVLTDTIDFDSYFREHQDAGAKVKPASAWAEEVIDRFYGEGAPVHWTRAGFDRMADKFDLRPGEVTLWAGVNGHGKTTFLSHSMLNVMRDDAKVCIASMEMKPRDTLAKLSRQASGVASPTTEYIRAFSRWTDDRLWIYDHLGRLAPDRALAVATYVRKELGIEHLVIDSLMKCGIGVEDLTGQKDFVDGLCAIARDTGLHIHLVAHMRKGENEKTAPGKFDVKGAGEITDLVDNLLIVWKNGRKTEDTSTEPDAFVRVAKQRHFSWEGAFSFWFDKASQQFKEHDRARVTFLDLDLDLDLRRAA